MARWDSTAGKCSLLHRSITLSCFGRFPLVILLLHRHHLLPPTHFFSVNSWSLAFCFSSYKIFRHFLYTTSNRAENSSRMTWLCWAPHFQSGVETVKRRKAERTKNAKKKDSWDESLLSSSSYAGEEEENEKKSGAVYNTRPHQGTSSRFPSSYFSLPSPQQNGPAR